MNTEEIVSELKKATGQSPVIHSEITREGMTTIWVGRKAIIPVLSYLKTGTAKPFSMLYDLTCIDERLREHRNGQPPSDFTLVYVLTSFERNEDIRIKVPLQENDLHSKSITEIWESANWYEREVYDMFGVKFDGHPRLTRILMPLSWEGHPLRKEHYSKATEVEPFRLTEQLRSIEEDNLRFNPEEYGLSKKSGDSEFMFLNLGPQHPGTHGLLRLIVQLHGEQLEKAEKTSPRATMAAIKPFTWMPSPNILLNRSWTP